ncbi:MAG: DUF4167 domain-containing protein [Pseudomonadota bacterium]
MRDFKGMKRQRGRNRGGGGKPQHNANRAFDSNGPDGVKVRGNAQTVFEKYQQLARDATSSGDRVLAENYLQHAEHYFRLLRAMQPQRSPSEILGRDQVTSGLDIDFEDESGQAQGEAAEAEGQEAEGEERGGRERDRDDNRRDDNRRDENRRDREDGGRRESRRDRWRDRDDRRDRGERSDRGERPDRGERGDRPERDPMPVVEPQATPLVAESVSDAPVLRDADGGSSEAPAFLQARAEPRAEGDEAPARRPRRRRAPRSFEGGEGAAASETEDA